MRKYLRVAWAWFGDEMSRRRLLRLCLIAGMLAGLFAHGFMFANKIPNHDDLYYDVDISGAGVESGRFALFFFWKLFSNLSAPWLNGILGVGFLSCAAALLSDAFGLRRRWQALSLTLIVVVFPENISLFCFMYEAHVFALGVMFAALAAWLVPRGRFGWLWAVVVVVLATGIYQVYLLLATGLMVIAILREVSVGGHAWKLTVRCAAAALAGLVLYMLAAKLALRLTGSALNQYQGIDKMGSLDVSAIPTKLAQAYGTVFNYFIADTPIYLTKLMRLAQGALALGGVAAAVWIAVRAFARRQAMDGVLALGCMAVLPVVMAGIYFMGDDISVHSLVLYPLVLLLLAPALLLPGLLEGLPHPNARRVLAVALTVVCAVYGLWGAVLSNQAYYKLYLAYTRSEHFANRMAARIEQTEGYVPGMTVALYGYVYGYIPEGLVYFEPDDTYRFTPMAGIITELDYINFLTMPKLLTRMIGLPVEATTTWQPQTEEETAAVAAMPSYPREGSISMVGDVCVVKFGTLNP